jgi:hypothetical protein
MALAGAGIALSALGAPSTLAAPAPAPARPGFFVSPAEHRAELSFPGSHGYEVTVQLSHQEGFAGRSAFVVATRGGSSAEYSARRGTLAADGSLGLRLPGAVRIRLRFVPTGVSREPPGEKCEGRPTVVERGEFRGTIEVRGRQGFTEARRSSAPGTVIRAFRQVCDNRHPHVIGARATRAAGPPPSGTLLFAGTSSRGIHRLFLASVFGLGGGPTRPEFDVDATVVHGGVTFVSSLHRAAGPTTFAVPDLNSLATAAVAPPAPFSGTAEFTDTVSHQTTFQGDLSVDLPGFGRVALTGNDFFAELCSSNRCRGNAPHQH